MLRAEPVKGGPSLATSPSQWRRERRAIFSSRLGAAPQYEGVDFDTFLAPPRALQRLGLFSAGFLNQKREELRELFALCLRCIGMPRRYFMLHESGAGNTVSRPDHAKTHLPHSLPKKAIAP